MVDSKGSTERKKHEIKEKSFKQTSDLLERERNLDSEKINHMKYLFWEIGSLRKPGQGTIEPFDPTRIESHLRLSGQILTRWEYNLLIEMDLMFRSAITRNR